MSRIVIGKMVGAIELNMKNVRWVAFQVDTVAGIQAWDQKQRCVWGRRILRVQVNPMFHILI